MFIHIIIINLTIIIRYNIGVNDQLTTSKVRLNGIEWSPTRIDSRDSDTKDYVIWMKKLVKAGYPTTICVYMNHYLFYRSDDVNAGFKEYDHIVTVSKIESNYDDDEYHDDDIITIADHALWSPNRTPVYYFSYKVGDWIGNRQTANDPNGLLYTLPQRKVQNSNSTITLVRNYGIAQTGILDEDSECLPIVIKTDKNYENPVIKVLSEQRPEPMPLILTITVSNLHIGEKYNLYKYNDEKMIPTKNFNANKDKAIATHTFVASTSEYTITENIMSDNKVIYRAVHA